MIDVRRLDASSEEAFFAFQDRACEGGCYCAAWWVADWGDWSERSAATNRALRAELFERGEHDGYLAHDDSGVVAWVQVGPRDRLAKLVRDFELEPDSQAWAITCFLVHPARRGAGVARAALAGVLDDLRARGVRAVFELIL